MRSLAIIPARGGSQRIPRKNLVDVGGGTLLNRALTSALACHNCIVITDDDEIAERAAAYRRPSSMGIVHVARETNPGHRRSMEDVITEAIGRDGQVPRGDIECAVILQPTSPMRTAGHVGNALRLLRESGADSVVSGRCGRDVGFFVALAETLDGGKLREPVRRPFSQDVPEMFRENGAIYAFTMEHWRKTGQRRGGVCLPFPMSERDSIDIDTPEDLELVHVLVGDSEWKRRAEAAERTLWAMRRGRRAFDEYVWGDDPGVDDGE